MTWLAWFFGRMCEAWQFGKWRYSWKETKKHLSA